MVKDKPLTAPEIECYVAAYFDPRRNLIVPNVWWGLGFNHELDLLVLTKTGFAYEVEIKTNTADLKRDLKKRWGHKSGKLRKLYFAVPESMRDKALLIPDHAGVLLVQERGLARGNVFKLREAKNNPDCRRLTEAEREKLGWLAGMRIWSLKRDLFHAYDEYDPERWRLEFMG